MAKRQRFKSLKTNVKNTSLKRFDRLRTLNRINLSLPELTELIKTDEFEDIKVSDEELVELEADGWQYVSSSNVLATKLIIDNDRKKMQVMFGDGSIYEWISGAESLYNGLLSSGSKGAAIRRLGMYGTHARQIN